MLAVAFVVAAECSAGTQDSELVQEHQDMVQSMESPSVAVVASGMARLHSQMG